MDLKGVEVLRQQFQCALVVTAILLPAPALAAVEFVAHRALYKMKLQEANLGTGIAAVSGTMAVEWRDACTGWTFEYKSVIEVRFSEGRSLTLASTATTWESRDGRDYRFNIRHKSNGQVTERIEGVAKAGNPGREGRVVLSLPERRNIALPAGTLFPVAHTLALVGAAAQNAAAQNKVPAFVSRNVFDGMDEKGLYQVTAVIGGAGRQTDDELPPRGALKNTRWWPVDLAYFGVASRKSVPDHEIKMRLYENGIADDLLLDFEDFIIRAEIDRVEIFPEPSCG